jgi:hypothetical protein
MAEVESRGSGFMLSMHCALCRVEQAFDANWRAAERAVLRHNNQYHPEIEDIRTCCECKKNFDLVKEPELQVCPFCDHSCDACYPHTPSDAEDVE